MANEAQRKTREDLVHAQGTPGLARYTAFDGKDHWSGQVEAAANTMTGWHHDPPGGKPLRSGRGGDHRGIGEGPPVFPADGPEPG